MRQRWSVICVLGFAAATSACQSLPTQPPAQVPPLPANISKREPTLTQELLKLLSPSPSEETKQSEN